MKNVWCIDEKKIQNSTRPRRPSWDRMDWFDFKILIQPDISKMTAVSRSYYRYFTKKMSRIPALLLPFSLSFPFPPSFTSSSVFPPPPIFHHPAQAGPFSAGRVSINTVEVAYQHSRRQWVVAWQKSLTRKPPHSLLLSTLEDRTWGFRWFVGWFVDWFVWRRDNCRIKVPFDSLVAHQYLPPISSREASHHHPQWATALTHELSRQKRRWVVAATAMLQVDDCVVYYCVLLCYWESDRWLGVFEN